MNAPGNDAQPRPAGDQGPEARISLVGTAIVLLRHRRVVAGCTVVVFVATLAYTLLFPKYTAESSFTPNGTQGLASQFAGLAAQFGVNIGGGSDQSVDFYAELVKSQALLTELARTRFRFAKTIGGADTLEGTLIDLYGLGGSTPEEQLQRCLDKLERRVVVTARIRANIVRIETTARWADLARKMNRRLLALVDEFNTSKLQLQAASQRQFAEGRMRQAFQELGVAEDSLRGFLERNRTYQTSPALSFEEARLQRRVDLRQQVYTSLAQAFEQARIDEVRNTPVITIVDTPEDSVQLDGKPIPRTALGLLIGLLLGIGLALVRENVVRRRQAAPEEFEEVRRLLVGLRTALSPSRTGRALEGGSVPRTPPRR